MHSSKVQGKAVRLLVAGVDDTAIYTAELRQAGFDAHVETVQNNLEFRRKISTAHYDLFVGDADCPEWSFREALHDLAQIRSDTPLVVIAAKVNAAFAMECIDAGVFDCVRKDTAYRLTLAMRHVLIARKLREQRDEVENTLRDTIQTVSAVIEASPLAIIALDTHGCVQMWNLGAEKMFGWTEHEVLGQPLPTVPDDERQNFQVLLDAQLHGQAHSGLEIRRIRKDGTELQVTLWTSPLRNAQGEITGKLAVLADVTESKRAAAEHTLLRKQEQLAKSEARSATRFRKILESAPDAILEVDSKGRIVVANKEAERIFGWGLNGLIGKEIESLLPERFRRRHLNHRSAYSVEPTTRPMGTGLDLFALRKNGEEFAVDINLSPFEDEQGKHVICVVRDVSERRRSDERVRLLNQNLERRTEELAVANHELELQNREVERANRLKSEFLASMSHELRTPLNAIIGFSELLKEQTAKILTDKQKRFLGHIYQGAQHLLELINDVLDLSKIEAGRLELRMENFTMAIAVAEVLSSVRPLATSKNINLESSLPMDVFLNADRVRFKEVLYNLFSNAIKFTPYGGRVWIESWVQGGSLTTVVGDTGVGIAPEDHASIFESFHQVGATTKGVREGTGLGLAITRRLIEQHGGQIWLESAPGAGSRFHFTLPLTGTSAVPEIESVKRVGHTRREQPLVLVVEDDRSSQELMVSYLESAGYQTATAESGIEALKLARELRPDIITLDMLLPGKHGIETLQELRSSPATQNIPVVIVSVMDEPNIGLSLGATEYLVKPIAKDDLIDAVRKHLKVPGTSSVLVVDDESDNLQLVARMLEDAGFPSVLAQSGMEALQVLGSEPVGAVVLDLLMPEMNGFEVIRKIRERNEFAGLPVLVLTAKDLSEHEREVLQGQVQVCLSKGDSWKPALLERLRALVPPATTKA